MKNAKVILTWAFWFQALSANAASVELLFGQEAEATEAPWHPTQDLRPVNGNLLLIWLFGYLLIEFWGLEVNYTGYSTRILSIIYNLY